MPTKSKLFFILNEGLESEIRVTYLPEPGTSDQVIVVYPNWKVGNEIAKVSYYRLCHYEHSLIDLKRIIDTGVNDDTEKTLSDAEKTKFTEIYQIEQLALQIINDFINEAVTKEVCSYANKINNN